MKVRIKRLDKTLPLPKYAGKDSLRIELTCRKDTIVEPNGIKLVPTNVEIDTPKGYIFILASHAAIPSEKGLLSPQGITVLDFASDGLATGPDVPGEKRTGELKLQVYNFTDERAIIMRGQKMAEGIFVKAECAQWQEIK